MESDMTDMYLYPDDMPDLCMGILRRAIADYKLALKKKRERAIKKLEKFFYSEYCEQMLVCIQFSADIFYEKLSRIEEKYKTKE